MTKIVLYVLGGWAAFAAARAAGKMLPASPVWLGQVALKALMLVFALAAMRLSGRRWADFGFRAPVGPWKKQAIAVGLAMGAAATLLVLLAGGKGLQPMMKDYRFYQIVLAIWFWSSVTEEVFTRGWLQSSLGRAGWIVSGLFFGSMHVTVLWAGADMVSGLILIAATTALGLWCGWLRDRHESLTPAVAAHVAFNVGGMLGGIVYTIGHIVRHGKPPAL